VTSIQEKALETVYKRLAKLHDALDVLDEVLRPIDDRDFDADPDED